MVYIIIILLLKAVQSLLNKQCSNGITNNVMFLKYLTIRQFASAFLGIVLVAFTVSGLSALIPDPLTVLFALVMAVSLAVGTFSGIMALKSGTMVLNSLFGMAGLFVPCIAGVFLFNESISLIQLLGLAVFIVAAALLIGCSRGIYKNFSVKTFLLLLVTLFSNGATMLAQKMFSYYVPGGEASVFNFYSFFFSALLSLLMFAVFRGRAIARKEEISAAIPRKIILFGLALSAAVFIISQVATVASAQIPSVILFPFSNGGGMLICAVVSATVYKEKLNTRSVIGLVLGTIALIIINFG